MQQFSPGWMERWRDRVNSDGVMKNVGRYFDGDVLLDFGDQQAYVVQFQSGRIGHVSDGVGPEDRYQFALRAPQASWSKFAEPTPPPMYNDIWAMGHPLHGRLKIEGDVKAMWQNARAFTWALSLMRQVRN